MPGDVDSEFAGKEAGTITTGFQIKNDYSKRDYLQPKGRPGERGVRSKAICKELDGSKFDIFRSEND
jgi:hypothetical protein